MLTDPVFFRNQHFRRTGWCRSAHIRSKIGNGKVDLIINSPIGKDSVNDDSYLRKAAIKGRIPYMTTIAAAKATADGIAQLRAHGNSEVKSLQELHSEIHDK